MATFRCTIVTPSDSLLDEQVTYATFQAWDGQKGVAPGASAFLAKLGTGAARLDLASGQSRWFVIDGGFAQMQGDALTLLVDGAEDAGGDRCRQGADGTRRGQCSRERHQPQSAHPRAA